MDAITNNDWPSRTVRSYNSVRVIGTPVDVGTPTEPVTLAEVKTHLRVDFTDDDTYLSDTIKECRQLFERITGIGIVSKTVTAEVRNALGNIELPYWPVTSISSAVDEYGTTLTNYDFYGSTYLRTRMDNLFTVVYVTTAMGTVPSDIKKAIKLMVAYSYRHRGDEGTDEFNKALYNYCIFFKRGSWLL
jgi:hypothetical protein